MRTVQDGRQQDAQLSIGQPAEVEALYDPVLPQGDDVVGRRDTRTHRADERRFTICHELSHEGR